MDGWFVHRDVIRVQIVPRHLQELVLVLPTERIVFELLGFSRGRRRFGYLSD
jgi:hypothetical protein